MDNENSILQIIEDNEVFSVEAREGMVVFTEECDGEFSVTLTPIDVRRLAQELLEIADKTDGEVFEKIDGDHKGNETRRAPH